MNELWTCDGNGHGASFSRRALLTGGLVVGSAFFGATAANAQAKFAKRPRAAAGKTLVVIFLRGGADGLNLLVPHFEDDYYRLRPSLSIPKPKDPRYSDRQRAIPGDERFGLHPALAPWRELWESGSLAAVHACGSADQTRSHFEAMSAMERGVATARDSTQDGWVARYLDGSDAEGKLLRAVAFAGTAPDSLRGAAGGATLDSLESVSLSGPPSYRERLGRLYREGEDSVRASGRETLRLLDKLSGLKAVSGAGYPNSSLAQALSQTAALIRADVGLEVVLLEQGGWDTHVGQGGTEGWQASLAADLAGSTRAFADDMGPRMKDVLVLAISEFGRRAYENTGLGTDHGRGGVLWALGGSTVGGKVYGAWPGLSEGSLEGPGDLRVTTDYRTVMSEAVGKHLGIDPTPVFGVGRQGLAMLGV